MIGAKRKADPGKRLQETTQQTAQRAVERLLDLLNDADASHADVLKAAALIFERIYPAAAGGGAHSASLNNCILSGNTGHTNGGGSYGGTLNNCVLSGSWRRRGRRGL